MAIPRPDDAPPGLASLRQVFRPRRNGVDAAEALALTALAHVIGDGDRAARFCAITGVGGAELATYVRDPAFLGGVLDFVLDDDRLLVDVAAAAQVPAAAVMAARRRLPGAPPAE